MRRNSVLFIDKGNAKRMDKLEWTVEQAFGDIEALIKAYVRENTENEISLVEENFTTGNLVKGIEKKPVRWTLPWLKLPPPSTSA